MFPAFAVTSESYVDSVVATLQDKFPAENSNTVLVHGGGAGQIGVKQIYDETQSFETQTNSLVTAETFNAAVQTAIDTEFVCIEWLNNVRDDAHCLLYQIRAGTPKTIGLPNGYTRLEYITTNPNAYIDTQKRLGPNFEVYAKVMIFEDQKVQYFLGGINFFVGTYGVTFLCSGIGGNTTTGGIKHPGINQVFTFGLSPQWNMYFTGYKRQTNRPYRSGGALQIGRYYESADYIATVRFYSVQLYNNGVLDGNFIPARRDSDGELGMYDTVTGTFFTNSGTGEFIAGPDVNPNLYLPSGN